MSHTFLLPFRRYLNADGTMTATKPFSLTGSVTDFFTFVISIFTLFFDSLFSTKEQVKRKAAASGGRSSGGGGGNYMQRNKGYNSKDAVRRRGANVKGVADLKAADAACGGGG